MDSVRWLPAAVFCSLISFSGCRLHVGGSSAPPPPPSSSADQVLFSRVPRPTLQRASPSSSPSTNANLSIQINNLPGVDGSAVYIYDDLTCSHLKTYFATDIETSVVESMTLTSSGTYGYSARVYDGHLQGYSLCSLQNATYVLSAPAPQPSPSPSPYPYAAVQLWTVSQPGDYIGGGVNANNLPPASSFSASQNGNGVTATVNTGAGSWTLNFFAPGGRPLIPGKYSNATRWPFNSAANPGLSVYGFGRGCNMDSGTFVVREVAFGASGAVNKLVVDFAQLCDFSPGLLTGTLRINSTTDPATYDPNPPEAYPPPPLDPGFVLIFDSRTGDFIGGGLKQRWDNTDGIFSATAHGTTGISLGYSGGTDSWTLYFYAPGGSSLQPGTYSGAARWPFELASQPGLDITGDGRGCNTLTGSFTVYEITYTPLGAIQSFFADFQQFCDAGPALDGVIRYDAPPPLPP